MSIPLTAMTFHVLAYVGSLSAPNTRESLSALEDEVAARDGAAYVFGHDLTLFAGFAASPNLTASRVSTPLLKGVSRLWIRPIERNAGVVSNPNMLEALDHPVALRRAHAISVDAAHNGEAPETARTLLWVTPGLRPAPQGELHTLAGSSTSAAVGDAWTDVSGSMVWESLLPPGRWAVIGSEHVATHAIAHRWILGDAAWRPGALSQTSFGDRTHRYFYSGALGAWGEFESNTMPRLEVLCSASDDAHSFCLHVVRLDER